jgi:hypothetical protein
MKLKPAAILIISGLLLTSGFLICTLLLEKSFLVCAFSPPATAWSKTYGGARNDGAYSVIQTIDGGYALTGFASPDTTNNHEYWLIKTDSLGTMQWSKTYGGIGIDDAYSVIETADGGYAMAGFTNSSGAGNYDGWLVKVDSAGNMQWNKTYGGATADDLYTVVQTEDGGYALVGYTTSFGAGAADGQLVKVDSSGNLLWSQTYGGTGVDDTVSMVKTSDGGYALVGFTRSFGVGGTDFWLVKVDSEGVLQWNKTYGGPSDDSAHSIVQTSEGGYALAGFTYSFGSGDKDFWLVKVGPSGNMEWNRTFGGTGFDDAVSLVKTSEGGYALAGYTSSFGAGSSDVWVVKVDSFGNLVWSQTYGGVGADYAYSIIQTSDSGYTLVGNTASFGMGSSDCYFVKITAENSDSLPSPSLSSSPLASPSPSPLPTSLPTQTPTSYPSASPSSTPIISEFSLFAVLFLIVAVGLIAVFAKNRITSMRVLTYMCPPQVTITQFSQEPKI